MLGEHRKRGFARGVERLEIFDPEQRGLASSAGLNQIAKGPVETRPARLGLQLRRGRRGIRGTEKLEPEGQGDRVDGLRARQTAPHGAADVLR